jgi:hypothetical protein
VDVGPAVGEEPRVHDPAARQREIRLDHLTRSSRSARSIGVPRRLAGGASCCTAAQPAGHDLNRVTDQVGAATMRPALYLFREARAKER